MPPRRAIYSIIGLIAVITVVGIWARNSRQTTLPATMVLTSPEFNNSMPLPIDLTCDGLNQSPALEWSDWPDHTLSFALVVHDPDAPAKDWLHWLVVNIPFTTTSISRAEVPKGGNQIMNDANQVNWYGPCPPTGIHHYYFEIYALDTAHINTGDATTALADIKQHTLAKAELVGLYGRNQ